MTGAADSSSILAAIVTIGPAALLTLLLVRRRWPVRRLGAAFLSFAWLFSLQAVANNVAAVLALWQYKIEPAFLQTPLGLGIGLACLFGPLTFLLFPATRLARLLPLAVALDAAILAWTAEASIAGFVLRAVAICGIVAAAQGLARMTAEQRNIRWRAFLQGIAWILLIFWQFPSAVFAQTVGGWSLDALAPAYVAAPLCLALLLLVLAGVNAMQDFALRGDGTPFPFDPPKRLVVSGAYAYVRNPMQVAICGGLLLLGGLFRQPGIAFGAIEAVILFIAFRHVCAGTSTVKQDDPLAPAYQAGVPSWLPRWHPWHPNLDGRAPLDQLQGPSGSLMRWIGRRKPRGLALCIADGESWQFRSGDGQYHAHGPAAFGQALQHINLAWAALGWLLCLLPVSRHSSDGTRAPLPAPETAAPR